MKKESVILYANQWGALARLTDEQLGFLFRAVFLWLNDKPLETESWEQALFVAFQFLTLQISIDNEKYLQNKKRRIASRVQKNKQTNVKDVSASSRARVDVDVDEDVDDDEDVSLSLLKPKNTDTTKEKKDKDEKFINFIRFWNFTIEQTGSRMRKIKILTASRREAMQRIMDQFPSDKAAQAIYNAMRSPFCNGETQRRSKPADFDWLMKPENFTKALEGNL